MQKKTLQQRVYDKLKDYIDELDGKYISISYYNIDGEVKEITLTSEVCPAGQLLTYEEIAEITGISEKAYNALKEVYNDLKNRDDDEVIVESDLYGTTIYIKE